MKRLSHTVRGLAAGLWICQKNNRTPRARAAMFINNCVLYSFAVFCFSFFSWYFYIFLLCTCSNSIFSRAKLAFDVLSIQSKSRNERFPLWTTPKFPVLPRNRFRTAVTEGIPFIIQILTTQTFNQNSSSLLDLTLQQKDTFQNRQ